MDVFKLIFLVGVVLFIKSLLLSPVLSGQENQDFGEDEYSLIKDVSDNFGISLSKSSNIVEYITDDFYDNIDDICQDNRDYHRYDHNEPEGPYREM